MTKTLLEGVVRGVPDGAFINAVAASRNVVALERDTVRSLHRDSAAMGVAPELAEKIVPMVQATLRLALDAPDVSVEDKTAACLVAERVMLAVVVAILRDDQPTSPTND